MLFNYNHCVSIADYIILHAGFKFIGKCEAPGFNFFFNCVELQFMRSCGRSKNVYPRGPTGRSILV